MPQDEAPATAKKKKNQNLLRFLLSHKGEQTRTLQKTRQNSPVETIKITMSFLLSRENSWHGEPRECEKREREREKGLQKEKRETFRGF